MMLSVEGGSQSAIREKKYVNTINQHKEIKKKNDAQFAIGPQR
jgi:hypothetical protein